RASPPTREPAHRDQGPLTRRLPSLLARAPTPQDRAMSLTTDDSTSEASPNPLDLDALESQLKARQTRRDGLTLMIWAFAAVALFTSAVAIGFGMRAIDESKQGGSAGGAGAAGGAAQVTLKEFSITPLMISASQSGGIDVVNSGNVEH